MGFGNKGPGQDAKSCVSTEQPILPPE